EHAGTRPCTSATATSTTSWGREPPASPGCCWTAITSTPNRSIARASPASKNCPHCWPTWGRWTMDDGRWTMDDGRWTMDDGRWTMDDGRWTMDEERRTMKDVRHRMDAVRIVLYAFTCQMQPATAKQRHAAFTLCTAHTAQC